MRKVQYYTYIDMLSYDIFNRVAGHTCLINALFLCDEYLDVLKYRQVPGSRRRLSRAESQEAEGPTAALRKFDFQTSAPKATFSNLQFAIEC